MSQPSHDDEPHAKQSDPALLGGFFSDRGDLVRTVVGIAVGVGLLAVLAVIALAAGLRVAPTWSAPGL